MAETNVLLCRMFSASVWATVCKTVCPMLSDYCLSSVLSVTLVYCGQTVWRIKMKLGVQVGLGPGDFVLDGDPTPPPNFSAHVYSSYCNFVRTLHKRKALLVCSSSSLVFYAFYFLESLIVLSLSHYAQLHHSTDSWSRSCKLVAF